MTPELATEYADALHEAFCAENERQMAHFAIQLLSGVVVNLARIAEAAVILSHPIHTVPSPAPSNPETKS